MNRDFFALAVAMIAGGVFLVPAPVGGFVSVTLAAVVSGLPQWLALKRHGVRSWWLLTGLVMFPVLLVLRDVGWRLGVPVFYTDRITLEPGEPTRPLWTWGWWTVGLALAGLVLGLLQWPLLGGKVKRAGFWPVISVIAWACLGAAKMWPGLPRSLQGLSSSGFPKLLIGPLIWAAVMAAGLRLLGARSTEPPSSPREPSPPA